VEKITSEQLKEITRRIEEAVHPDRIFLFGSHAWGHPGEDSDVDIFVVLPHSDQPGYRRAREIYRCLRGLTVPVDVVVKTREEVERGKEVKASLVRKVLEEGKLLHG